MSGFSKLDSGIIYSSIWDEKPSVAKLWITILAMKDEYGFVATSAGGLRNASRLSSEEFNAGIAILEQPDPDSRTKANDGRRIEKVEGGWIVLNSDKYRDRESLKKKKHSEYMREWRERNKNKVDVNKCDTHVNSQQLTPASPSVSVSASVSDSVSSLPLSNILKKEKKYKKEKFDPPDISMVQEYCSERKNGIDASHFIDFYTSKNWMIGKNKMKDWKAAVRTWEKHENKNRYLTPAEKTRQTLDKMEREGRL